MAAKHVSAQPTIEIRIIVYGVHGQLVEQGAFPCYSQTFPSNCWNSSTISSAWMLLRSIWVDVSTTLTLPGNPRELLLPPAWHRLRSRSRSGAPPVHPDSWLCLRKTKRGLEYCKMAPATSPLCWFTTLSFIGKLPIHFFKRNPV